MKIIQHYDSPTIVTQKAVAAGVATVEVATKMSKILDSKSHTVDHALNLNSHTGHSLSIAKIYTNLFSLQINSPNVSTNVLATTHIRFVTYYLHFKQVSLLLI